MGANRYWCEDGFGAIKKFLWIKIGHFSSFFSLFGHSNGCCSHSYAYFRNRLHPKTRQTYGMMVWNHFWPPRPYIHGWRGSKMAHFLGQNQATMAGQFQSLWHLKNEPFSTPPSHGYMAGVVKNGPKSFCPMYWKVIWRIKWFPGGFPALERACHSHLILT